MQMGLDYAPGCLLVDTARARGCFVAACILGLGASAIPGNIGSLAASVDPESKLQEKKIKIISRAQSWTLVEDLKHYPLRSRTSICTHLAARRRMEPGETLEFVQAAALDSPSDREAECTGKPATDSNSRGCSVYQHKYILDPHGGFRVANWQCQDEPNGEKGPGETLAQFINIASSLVGVSKNLRVHRFEVPTFRVNTAPIS
ncbi:hypothetical protein GALMADRAFT_206602 [Galerina marginata CBS 339.88]|uniref:Uncharacterized protein n=1 Tax=Galerina marginata (strain CBS 339.88) TaxID=685588 RepID=A0A067TSH8_GALM3|nr:hypothetical protein GALMADRAFT_206602 [Galerina marginata CBS 339.88]